MEEQNQDDTHEAEPQQETSSVPPVDQPSSDDRTMAMLCHLLALPTGFIGPLVIWLIKKDQSAFVDDQGKEALNFQITVLIAMLVAVATFCIFIGIVLAIAVAIANIVLCIIGCMKAYNGECYRYPWAIRFLK